eukprot:1393289-Amorphochlora_amoeboformis.AAC.2
MNGSRGRDSKEDGEILDSYQNEDGVSDGRDSMREKSKKKKKKKKDKKGEDEVSKKKSKRSRSPRREKEKSRKKHKTEDSGRDRDYDVDRVTCKLNGIHSVRAASDCSLSQDDDRPSKSSRDRGASFRLS